MLINIKSKDNHLNPLRFFKMLKTPSSTNNDAKALVAGQMLTELTIHISAKVNYHICP